MREQSAGFYQVNGIYMGVCVLLNTNPQIKYPITNGSELPPKVISMESNTKFIYSTPYQRYEIWDFQCSIKDYQLKMESKGKASIRWWGLRNRKFLETVIESGYDAEKKRPTYNFISTNLKTQKKKIFGLPCFKEFPSVFRRLSTPQKQNVILYLLADKIGICFPKIGSYIEIEYGPKLIRFENDLSRFISFQNDFLFIGSLTNSTCLCILIDSYSRPVSFFEFSAQHEFNRDRSISLVSSSTFVGIDSKQGNFVELDFDYKNLVLQRPDLFLPLLHYSVLRHGNKTTILNCLSNDLLRFYWSRPIFDEYFLVLLRNKSSLTSSSENFIPDTKITFCNHNFCKKYFDKFESYTTIKDDEICYPNLKNWGQARRTRPQIVKPVFQILLDFIIGFDFNLISTCLHFNVQIRLLEILFNIQPDYISPQEYFTIGAQTLPNNMIEIWECCEMISASKKAPLDYSNEKVSGNQTNTQENIDENLILQKWWNWHVQDCQQIDFLNESGDIFQFTMYTDAKQQKDIADFYKLMIGDDFNGIFA